MDLTVDLRPVLFRNLSQDLSQIGLLHQSRIGSDLPAALLRSKEDLFQFLFPVLLLLLELLLLMLLSKGLQEGRAIQCGSRESGSLATACLTARWRPCCPCFPLLLLLLLSGYPWRARLAPTC